MQWVAIFVPQLPAFKITDLIDILLEKFDTNNEIVNIGLRPGEKIHELMINEVEIPRTYRFKDMYVITSMIEKYHANMQKAAYADEDQKLTIEEMPEYCSRDAVISKEEVKELFKQLNLL